ncbi:CLUMA_CG004853, isoform A [Clunio marinus]|uniref:CLUMA_CG004853, isoform A n=1 Tax=Clunio marinus TaxID=568069 RepID=A0A1J1HSX1_9DIPT|nr:CLUMA_CG004853, isoform A [Clunio marinus]
MFVKHKDVEECLRNTKTSCLAATKICLAVSSAKHVFGLSDLFSKTQRHDSETLSIISHGVTSSHSLFYLCRNKLEKRDLSNQILQLRIYLNKK